MEKIASIGNFVEMAGQVDVWQATPVSFQIHHWGWGWTESFIDFEGTKKEALDYAKSYRKDILEGFKKL